MDFNDGLGEFKTPKKFSTNFINILKEKSARSTEIQNKFQVFTDIESENKEQGLNTQRFKIQARKAKLNPQTKAANTKVTETQKLNTKKIIYEGRTDNHNNLKKVLQSIVKRKYTIKYTNNYTILYVEDEKDHKNLFSSFREAKISHHSYSSRSEKSQAFVLRGIAECTTIEQIEKDLMLSYDIKVRDFYKMSTLSTS